MLLSRGPANEPNATRAPSRFTSEVGSLRSVVVSSSDDGRGMPSVPILCQSDPRATHFAPSREDRNGRVSLHCAAAMSNDRLGRGSATVGTTRAGEVETVGRVVTRAAVAAVETRARLERAIRAADSSASTPWWSPHRADVRSSARPVPNDPPTPALPDDPRLRRPPCSRLRCSGRSRLRRASRRGRRRSPPWAAPGWSRARRAAVKGHPGSNSSAW